MDASTVFRRFSQEKWVCGLFILVIGYFTIVHNFWVPQALFWDENYHIASAQKYLSGVFFMEPHPPLGKLVIALGEKLLNFNPVDTQFTTTDYATNPPAGFVFTGYRLFPVLLAWLTAPLLYGIFLLLTRKPLWAMFLSFLYVFDNAMLVHLRSAMLESTLLFFSVLTIFAFLLLWYAQQDRGRLLKASLLFGFAFACVMTTKLFGLVLILLVPALLIRYRKQWRTFGRFCLWAGLAFFITYVAIWQIHFSLGSRIVPELPDKGHYQASDTYISLIEQGRNHSLLGFPVMYIDSIAFVRHYQRGVPTLNFCKSDENGSPFFYWPFGARSINYRWETDGRFYRYLYLQVNPVVWFAALAAVLLSFALLVGSLFFPLREEQRSPLLHWTFLALYVGFMVAVSRIDRVMYLYHYFLPLLFSFLLLAIIVLEMRAVGKMRLRDEHKSYGLLAFAFLIFVSFQFYRPLTYYVPMSDAQVQRRALLPWWELHCVRCDAKNPVANPK